MGARKNKTILHDNISLTGKKEKRLKEKTVFPKEMQFKEVRKLHKI